MTYTEDELAAIVRRHREAWARSLAPWFVLALSFGFTAGVTVAVWLT